MFKAISRTICPLAVVASILTPSMSTAGEITLTSVDQKVRISGEFSHISGDTYILEYKGYELRVPATSMNCKGDDCPAIVPAVQVSAVAQGES